MKIVVDTSRLTEKHLKITQMPPSIVKCRREQPTVVNY